MESSLLISRHRARGAQTSHETQLDTINLGGFEHMWPSLHEYPQANHKVNMAELYTRFGEGKLTGHTAASVLPLNRIITTPGVSPHYLGDPRLKANQSADIPEELSTSLWVTNLPPDLDYKTLLNSIRNCGKLFATVINRPDKKHTTAACKLVFFDVSGAENLLEQARAGYFCVGGYIPTVCRNRIKTPAKAPSPMSRVLHIEGPSSIVNKAYLEALFHSDGITWQDEEVLVLYKTECRTRLEWRFGSYRCQAESARHLIERIKQRAPGTYEDLLWQSVTVHFGIDPCAPNPVLQQTFPWPARQSLAGL